MWVTQNSALLNLPTVSLSAELPPKQRLQCFSLPHIIRLTGEWCCRETLVYSHQGEAQREAEELYCPSARRRWDGREHCEFNVEYSGPESGERH
jgi:hypothetical protein